MYLSIPYFLIRNIVSVAMFPKPNHPLYHGETNNGHKHIIFVKDYSLESMKAKCRDEKVSIHEAFIAVISVTMKEYFISKGDEKTS